MILYLISVILLVILLLITNLKNFIIRKLKFKNLKQMTKSSELLPRYNDIQNSSGSQNISTLSLNEIDTYPETHYQLKIKIIYINNRYTIARIISKRIGVHPIWEINDLIILSINNLKLKLDENFNFTNTTNVLFRIPFNSISLSHNHDYLVKLLTVLNVNAIGWNHALNQPRSQLRPGKWVLIPALTDNVDNITSALVGVRLAALRGLRVALVLFHDVLSNHVANTDDLKEKFLEAGGELFLTGEEDWVFQTMDATDGEGVHSIVVDCNEFQTGKDAIESMIIDCLVVSRKNGTLILTGQESQDLKPHDLKCISDVFTQVTKSVSIIGSNEGTRFDVRQVSGFVGRKLFQLPITVIQAGTTEAVNPTALKVNEIIHINE
ncbi:alcohol dehydrogenase ADH1 NDAI_0B02780 [Naumovozyma dairenensis CBS 421]|uniref:Uncharacterized protein n=1 Tax=Naumovozyma dairenensis (strain ATCC 10597 / BCRC 20456 / CBS 421 / NBRC 0211 / NRRL Y-12639) TaxID=1071378 RepID=G0W6A2_NAUDC|nr:hypothetical protein NDAI_0B02780 [Naumovozyma dairenensis CBS 421]CCD23313.1 hypothetical protein NDAI_0B02780 [Naumovozyma dairenensis CBS 421]